MTTTPPYLPQMMRVRARRHTPSQWRAREALAEALTDHNRRARGAHAKRVP